jgi:hypothetical protein
VYFDKRRPCWCAIKQKDKALITKQMQLLAGETLTAASLPGNVYLSPLIPYGWESAWIMVIRVTGGAAATGTTPSITPELDMIKDGAGPARIGGAITAITPTTLLVNNASAFVYAPGSGTAQGPITADTFPASGPDAHDYKLQVKLAFGNADNVIPGVFIDLIALN